VAFDDELTRLWRERVEGRFMYRGMSAKDLTDPLDPGHDPFAAIRPDLCRLIEALQRASREGFELTVHEDHSGLSFPLRDILAWSKRDLDDPGLDFTSVPTDGRGYARNFQGSQLRQNWRTITGQLPRRRGDPVLTLTDDDWDRVSRVNAWIVRGDPEHRALVIWVPRGSPAFDVARGCELVGSLDVCRERVLRRLGERGLPPAVDSLRKVLPDEERGFSVRLTAPLPLAQVAKVEELA